MAAAGLARALPSPVTGVGGKEGAGRGGDSTQAPGMCLSRWVVGCSTCQQWGRNDPAAELMTPKTLRPPRNRQTVVILVRIIPISAAANSHTAHETGPCNYIEPRQSGRACKRQVQSWAAQAANLRRSRSTRRRPRECWARKALHPICCCRQRGGCLQEASIHVCCRQTHTLWPCHTLVDSV